jgi:hypothetical protein
VEGTIGWRERLQNRSEIWDINTLISGTSCESFVFSKALFSLHRLQKSIDCQEYRNNINVCKRPNTGFSGSSPSPKLLHHWGPFSAEESGLLADALVQEGLREDDKPH